MPIARWRRQLRMVQALRLLGAGHQVTEVALLIGYATPSAFTSMFVRGSDVSAILRMKTLEKAPIVCGFYRLQGVQRVLARDVPNGPHVLQGIADRPFCLHSHWESPPLLAPRIRAFWSERGPGASHT